MYEDMWSSINMNVEIIIDIIKTAFLSIYIYWSIFKMINQKQNNNKIYKYLLVILASLFCEIIKYKIGFPISILCLLFLISIIYDAGNIGKSILLTAISFGLNGIFLVLSIIIDIIVYIYITQNDYVNLVVIIGIYTIILVQFFKIEKFKYGFNFLKKKQNDEYIEVLFLTSSNILLMITLWYYSDNYIVEEIAKCFIACIILMIINIAKLIQNSYKRNLLVKELEETKLELENRDKQIKEMEEEILSFNKKSHSIAHEQKALEYKLMKLENNFEISNELEIKSRINKIRKDFTKDVVDVKLDKTNIVLIDDMFEYLKSECKKDNIEFDLKIYENIYYMINNIISKEELEIIIADHVKNAIIAINHSNNTNKSILVKLGKIDDFYGLYVYDSGVEFSEEILENLGRKAITTYANEGGSGMGFLNTFDTLRKYKASLIIEKIGIPSKDNFTKIVKIKFDNKNEYKVV